MKSYTDELQVHDEFTGDPRVRDLWEATRRERHLLIRSMHGDPWPEKTSAQKAATALSNSFWFILSVPFLLAVFVAVGWIVYGVVCTLAGMPPDKIGSHMGGLGDGMLGDKILGISVLAAVGLSSYGVWRKTARIDREIHRLRGLSNTDLLLANDRWREQKDRQAKYEWQDIERLERRRDADYSAERIGAEMMRTLRRAGQDKNLTWP